MLQLRKTLTLAVLAGALGASACTSTSQVAGTPASSFAAVADPVLPDTVNAIPTGVSGDASDGVRSLAHEVESRGTGKSAAYAPEKQSGAVAQLAAVGTDAAAFPAAPIQQADAGDAQPVVVASLAPAVEPETPAAASIRGIAPTKPAPDVRVTEHGSVGARSAELDDLMAHYADYYGVPEELVRRVAKRESTFNPRATNGAYLGLMQISLPTARGMGYRGGREGLLDAETNLKYAVRYLRGAFVVAGGNHSKADRLYQSGYYYHAKRAGLLDETGVGTDRKRRRGV